MALLDFILRRWRRGTRGGGVGDPIGMGTLDNELEEPGEGGPSLFLSDLATLRWAAQQEAVNVGRQHLEPERWAGGRMAFPYERHLAHDHEGLRDRLSDFVAAEARNHVQELYELAGDVATSREELREKDREHTMVLDSWNRSYREVHEDELELGRYFRLKSRPYQLFKWGIAAAIFLAELAISIALFDEVVAQDIPAMPVLFAMGLILILMVVPHYSAIGIKEGVTRYHEAELDAYERRKLHAPAKLRKKARIEEVEDRGAKFTAGTVGLVLIFLFVPLSSLRAAELGGEGEARFGFWFWFFVLIQLAISGYFFLREWWDYGPASANLKHHDLAKRDKERERKHAFDAYSDAVREFMATAQDLVFLYRQAPRWDSYIVQSYLATIQHFRHLLTVQHPDLDVFIAHATVPTLSGLSVEHDAPSMASDPVSRDHAALRGRDAYSRGWWLKQVELALVDSVSWHGVDASAPPHPIGGQPDESATRPDLAFESPERLLAEMLERYYGLTYPYVRHHVEDHVELVDHDLEPDEASVPRPSQAQADAIVDLGSRRTAPELALEE